MIFSDSKLVGMEKEFGELENKILPLGFARWTWDYAKLMYDLELKTDGLTYYLRLPGRVTNNKSLEHSKAMIRLGEPIFARHFFPHGLDSHVDIPESLQATVEGTLKAVEEALNNK